MKLCLQFNLNHFVHLDALFASFCTVPLINGQHITQKYQSINMADELNRVST